MMDNTFWLIKSGNPDHWPEWDDQEVISVGWDVGDYADEPWDKFRQRIKDKFDTNDTVWAGNATGAIKMVAGTHRSSNKQMAAGDIAIIIGTDHVFGHSVIRGVAKLGEYEFREEGLTGTGFHQYQRNIGEWLYNNGPIPKTKLADRFNQGGDDSLHLASTIKRSKFQDRKTLDTLLSQLEKIDPIEEPEYGFELEDEQTLSWYLEENIDRLNEPHIDEVSREVQLTKKSRVDLFCTRADGHPPLLVELKKGLGTTDHLDQLRRYLNAYDGHAEGLLIVQQFKNDVTAKVAAQDDVRLKEFEIELTLTD
ncbi:hypothetical protein [Halobacterium hubeiense]|uniref:hypothetical protein n=1 Tax=Halobacterium hubeiense TaxID=1407499 RepID=UPI003C75053D